MPTRCAVCFQVLSDVVNFNSRMKWQVGATKYRKEKLEELRVGLRSHCEKSLQKFSHDIVIASLLEFEKATGHVRSPSVLCVTFLYGIFFKSDILCERAERTEVQRLRENLIQIVEEISCDMPQLCIREAGGSDNPVTHHEVNITQRLSNQQFSSRRRDILDSVRSTLASWLKQLNWPVLTSARPPGQCKFYDWNYLGVGSWGKGGRLDYRRKIEMFSRCPTKRPGTCRAIHARGRGPIRKEALAAFYMFILKMYKGREDITYRNEERGKAHEEGKSAWINCRFADKIFSNSQRTSSNAASNEASGSDVQILPEGTSHKRKTRDNVLFTPQGANQANEVCHPTSCLW